MIIKLILNNQPKELLFSQSGDVTLSSIFRNLELKSGQAAVRINDRFIKIKEYDSCKVNHDDKVEVITLIAGG